MPHDAGINGTRANKLDITDITIGAHHVFKQERGDTPGLDTHRLAVGEQNTQSRSCYYRNRVNPRPNRTTLFVHRQTNALFDKYDVNI